MTTSGQIEEALREVGGDKQKKKLGLQKQTREKEKGDKEAR